MVGVRTSNQSKMNWYQQIMNRPKGKPFIWYHNGPPIALIICGIIILLLIRSVYFISSTHYLFDPSFKNKANQITYRPLQQVPNVIEKADDNMAYVFLALGAQAHQLNCIGSIESLVRYGTWDGHVYMLTDRLDCFDIKDVLKKTTINPLKFHIIDVHEDFSSGGIDLLHLKTICFRKQRMKSFLMKTKLFDYIKDQHIDIIAYIDCDIIFGIPGCAKRFITTGTSWNENSLRFSRIYRDNNNNFQGIHAGVMVAHRNYSKFALKLWENELLLNKVEGDNDAYSNAYFKYQKEYLHGSFNNTGINSIIMTNNTKNTRYLRSLLQNSTNIENSIDQIEIKTIKNINRKLNINPNNNNINPLEPFELKNFEHFIDPTVNNTNCMNHISKARCQRYGRAQIQSYVNIYNLNTYENKYPYCTSNYLQPLLYGWFPFRYIPYCPKLETFL